MDTRPALGVRSNRDLAYGKLENRFATETRKHETLAGIKY